MPCKILNKINIIISSNLDIKYSCIKTHSYILEYFKKSARYHYDDKNIIVLYPYKSYETEDEFVRVCNDVYNIIRSCNDATIFTYKYKNNDDKKCFRFAKNEKRQSVFIEDTDDEEIEKVKTNTSMV